MTITLIIIVIIPVMFIVLPVNKSKC